MAEPLPLNAFTTLEEQTEALYRDGYVYLPGVLDADQVELLRDRMDALDAIPECFDKHTDPAEHGFLNKSINNTFNRHQHFLQFLDWPGVIEIAEAVHGEDCHCIGMTAWMTGDGRPDQTLHVDWLPVSLPQDVLADPRVRLPIFITTTHFYLDDLSPELGPTTFVPGSHLSGQGPDGETTWQEQSEESILCHAGDVVIFRSEVWHRGTANTSGRTRYLLQVHYAKRMITQKYPPYLNRFQFEPHILQQASPQQLRLMGDHRPSNYD
jgi:ectoine hydroxylase-related dioxygenase (phytanoyl-CoA dioxygenase family)